MKAKVLKQQIPYLPMIFKILKKNISQNALKIQKLENDNFQMKVKNQSLEQRIEKLENEFFYLLKSSEEIKQSTKEEIAKIKNEQKKNLKICMNNFKELKEYFKYLEDNNMDLYDQYKDLERQFNLFVDYSINYMNVDDNNCFNYNLNFK